MIPIIPFVIGGAIGAVGALMLSPRSGEENRELVAEKVDYYAGHGEQIFHRAADTVRDTADGVVENAQPAADDIREKINEARDRIAEQVTRNREAQQVEAEVTDEAAEAVEEAAEEAADAQ
jgi:gas vesicle protein